MKGRKRKFRFLRAAFTLGSIGKRTQEGHMSRTLRALILLAFVASCGGGSVEPPRNLDNACAILAERPDFKRAFRRAERKWGVPVHVQMSTIYHESKFEGDARTPLKFALGVIDFLLG